MHPVRQLYFTYIYKKYMISKLYCVDNRLDCFGRQLGTSYPITYVRLCIIANQNVGLLYHQQNWSSNPFLSFLPLVIPLGRE